MGESGKMKGLNRIFIWFSNLAYLNLLWVVFTLFGFIILGVAPSTSALFAVIRKLLQNEGKVSITKTYYEYFRRDFWKINRVFYVLLLVGFIIFVDIYFLYGLKNTLATLFLYLLMVLSIIYFVTCLFIFPVFVHYDLKMLENIKQAFLMGMTKPLYILGIVVSLVVSYVVLIYLKTLFIFFGISLGAFIIMSACYHMFIQMKLNTGK
ncbi:DUF624 domain-containing protein [Robertmurraya massiliosenegalensis]|uniref:YesL family protein n=1 Tax=Robertmurraya TaxID=2837507 RepID=UPI0039A633D2